MWTGGYNAYGQLGMGDTTNRSFLTKIDTGCTDIAAGYYYTWVLKNGAVYGCGYNISGGLGDGTTTNRYSLTAAIGEGTSGISKLHKGLCSHLFVLKSGAVYGCGYNNNGQLGIGVTGNKSTLTACVGAGSSGVTDIYVGEPNMSCIIKSGAGYICGYLPYTCGGWTGASRPNGYATANWIAWTGQGASGVSDVRLGSATIILKSGVLYATGSNNSGQLGLGTTGLQYTDWTPCVGEGTSGVTSLANGINDYSSIGFGHWSIMIKNGAAYYTGSGNLGEVGIGSDYFFSTSFAAIPGFGASNVTAATLGATSSYVIAQGKVYAAGRNTFGDQLNGVIDGAIYNTLHTTTGM